ncbi:cytochrome P450 [Apiospora arundinis]|uniref:Cytochrome P450 n=1 Tax=Apiospora arundinis TaxID=335852 RepID=A0ABR2IH99_9PEZI
MVNVLVIGSALVAATLLYSVAGLYTNYQKVRKTGIPVIVSPFYTFNPLWIIAQSWFAPRKWFLPLCRLLPEPFSLFTRVVLMDWPKEDGCELHDRFGPAFWVISPGTIQLMCSDPVANEEIISKYKAWPKPPEHVAALGMYGPNVLTVEGEDWTRHKRIIGPCFNERTSVLVWEETMRQVQEMLDRRIFADPDHTHKTLCEDSRTIALHSFMGVGLGAPQDFSTGARQKSDGRQFSFRDSLTSVLHELILTTVASELPPAILKYLPKYISEKKIAFDEAGLYISDLVKKQEEASVTNGSGAGSESADKKRNTFLATLVSNARDDATAAAAEGAKGAVGGNRKTGFSKQDLMGNMFVMSFAGHDTTASSLAFTVGMLATRPDYQRWIQEEIDGVLALGIDRGDYKNLFPKLKRCQALLFETLRVFHPALLVTRQATTDNQMNVVLSPEDSAQKTAIQVPAGTLVHANLHATYMSPKLWGPDCEEWKPKRFIIPANTEKPGWPEYRPEPAGQTAEKLVAPPLALSSFWSMGPRICLGMKFSQVEFAVAMFTAFSQASVDPVPRPEVVARSSSAEAAVQEARVELKGVLDRSGFGTTGPLLHITEPEKIVLRWHKR